MNPVNPKCLMNKLWNILYTLAAEAKTGISFET